MRGGRWPAILLAGLLVVLAGCGVAPELEPEDIEVNAVPDAPPVPGAPAGGLDVTLYFVRGSHLEAVLRPAERVDQETALELLAAGPTADEVAAGLRTALLPQPLEVEPTGAAGDTVTVLVSRDFTGVAGGDQLRAVAQVVFTLTELPGPGQVRFATADGPVEVPTDQGLTVVPVDRDDYASVAPLASIAGMVPGEGQSQGQGQGQSQSQSQGRGQGQGQGQGQGDGAGDRAGTPPPAPPPGAPGSTGGRRSGRAASRPGTPA